jgi:hypothetical protein
MKLVPCGSRSLIKKEFCLFFMPKVEMSGEGGLLLKIPSTAKRICDDLS